VRCATLGFEIFPLWGNTIICIVHETAHFQKVVEGAGCWYPPLPRAVLHVYGQIEDLSDCSLAHASGYNSVESSRGETMARRKTWREKLGDDKDLPKDIEMDDRLSKKWGEGTCVIPAPREVDALMQRVPEGRLATIDVLREALALQHEATIACPLTTGIFAWIAAHAAEESEADGDGESTPYWRTLKARGELNPKYPGGLDALS
jgi:hypothetical protein